MGRLQKIPLLFILWLDLFLSLAALILETKTGSIVMLFAASGPNDIRPEYFNYLALTPFGYGNIFPLTVLLLSIVLTVYALLRLLPSTRKFYRIEQYILRLVILLNPLPYLIFWGGYKITAGAIGVEVIFLLKYCMSSYIKENL